MDITLNGMIERNGIQEWYKDGVLQRYNNCIRSESYETTQKNDDMYTDIRKDLHIVKWTKNNQLHSDRGPALTTVTTTTFITLGLEAQRTITTEEKWYQRGKLHRDDGPAIVDSNGNQQWYMHGKLHRENGLPAITKADGTEKFYENGINLKSPTHIIKNKIGSIRDKIFGKSNSSDVHPK